MYYTNSNEDNNEITLFEVPITGESVVEVHYNSTNHAYTVQGVIVSVLFGAWEQTKRS